MVGLPSPENREMIFRTLLSKEKVESGLDFKELATMTEGFTGSDLKVCSFFLFLFLFYNIFGVLMHLCFFLTMISPSKQNLCTTAAYRPVRELIQQERLKDMVSSFLLPLKINGLMKEIPAKRVLYLHACL